MANSQRKGSFVLRSAALADHTTRAAVGTAYEVPKGYGGRIYKIEAIAYQGATDTATPAGGLVELENGSVDWKPFKFYTNSLEILTTTGATSTLTKIDCDLPLPEGSTVTGYYTSRNAVTDVIMITCFVEYGTGARNQTFMDSAVGTAVTTAYTTTAKHVTFGAIPSTKGGKLRKIIATVNGTPETAVMEGGLIEVWASPSWGQPIQLATPSMGGKTTMSGQHLTTVWDDQDADLPDRAIVYADYTPVDNQSQFLEMSIMWTRS